MPARFAIPSEDAHVKMEELRLELSQQEPGSLIELDLGGITILDSMLLGQVLKTFLYCRERSIEMRLVNVSPHARWVIHNANLDSVLGLPKYAPPKWDSDVTSF